jgi:titin
MKKLSFILLLILSAQVYAGTYTVTNNGDNGGNDPAAGAGTGTLRQAIVDANAAGGTNTINFNIGSASTITLLATLPSISNVTINGFSETGAAANTAAVFGSTLNPTYKITITSGSSGANTLLTLGSSNVIKGLVFKDCASTGKLITVNGSSNQIIGCYIGMTSGGTSYGGGNATYGIYINGAASNVIGNGTKAGANLISGIGNYGYGIYITGSGATSNTIKGNIIGLQKDGATLVSSNSQLYGVYITSSAASNTVGGTGSEDGNVISGQYGKYTSPYKSGVGIFINSTATAGNTVIGNRIGTRSDGATYVTSNTQTYGIVLSSSKNNTIGGNSSSYRNVISGNEVYGILISGSTSTGNVIKGNYIGTQTNGTTFLASSTQEHGIHFNAAGTSNTIGGSGSGEGNVISGQSGTLGQGYGRGICLKGTSSTTIAGNIIGLQYNGTTILASQPTNQQYWGIEIDSLSASNTVGGTTSGARNIISGNSDAGIKIWSSNSTQAPTNNTVIGNYIGLQSDGLTVVASNTQGTGISIAGGPHDNTIGGTTYSSRNVISGNNNDGIEFGYITSSGTDYKPYSNTIKGNIIGLSKNGTVVTSSSQDKGISIGGSYNNTIGGTSTVNRNFISGNTSYGIYISHSYSTGNTVKGNYIGTDTTGGGSITTQPYGIYITNSAANNTIGGSASGEPNKIAYNTADGVYIFTTGATGNKISRNPIHNNNASGKPINLNYGGSQGNNGNAAPVITTATTTTVIGTSGASNTVEVFKNTTGSVYDAATYLGTATADGSGNWSLSVSLSAGDMVLATATDGSNNTSEFSAGNCTSTLAVSPGSATICYGSSVTFTASGNNTYSWSPSTGLNTTTGATVIASPTTTTTYTVTGTNTSGCTNTKAVTVTVNSLPIPSISGSPIACIGGTTLTASGGSSYLWSTGATTAVISVSPIVNTTYTVMGTSSSGCSGVSTHFLSVVASLGSGNNCMNNIANTDGVTWFSFVADSTHERIIADANGIIYLTVYSGSCNSLNIFASDTANLGDTALVIDNSNFSVGNTYYVKVTTNAGSNLNICTQLLLPYYCAPSAFVCDFIKNGGFEAGVPPTVPGGINGNFAYCWRSDALTACGIPINAINTPDLFDKTITGCSQTGAQCSQTLPGACVGIPVNFASTNGAVNTIWGVIGMPRFLKVHRWKQ